VASPRIAVLSIGATIIVALLAGCGSSGPSNRDKITAIVKQEGSHPATLCDHLSDELLSRVGGKAGCMRQAAASAADPTTRATSVSVHDTSARAVVVDRAGTRTIDFIKQKDGWKVAGVG
jgi:hypothetical protein